MTEEQREPCRHALCGCQVAAGQEYCSDECRNAQREYAAHNASSGTCGCGHAACRPAADAPGAA